MIANDYNTSSLQSRKQYLSLILNIKAPNLLTWIIKIWRFKQDVRTCYSGEDFDRSWEDRLNVFHHIYSKEYGKKLKVREEVQEYPNKRLKEAFMDKLKDDNNNDKTFTVGI